MDLSAEDAKLVTLARAAYGRSYVTTLARAGAAVRDDMGRTYAAASVEVEGVAVTAVQLAVAMAVSSGARSFEAGAVVAEEAVDRAPVDAFGVVPFHVARPDGSLVDG